MITGDMVQTSGCPLMILPQNPLALPRASSSRNAVLATASNACRGNGACDRRVIQPCAALSQAARLASYPADCRMGAEARNLETCRSVVNLGAVRCEAWVVPRAKSRNRAEGHGPSAQECRHPA